jgi:hypothetical protein
MLTCFERGGKETLRILKMTMNDNVSSHPYRELMAEAQHEWEVTNSPEGDALQTTMCAAIFAYSEFLDRHGLIWDHDYADVPRLKANALVITLDYVEGLGEKINYGLKDGALDRVYSNGTNPDCYGRGPPDIPHEKRITTAAMRSGAVIPFGRARDQ